MKLKQIILSWDFVISIIVVLTTIIILPEGDLRNKFCISFYNIGINVLSIVFSLFFASLAIIMSSSDNEFIEFLEQENDFSSLMKTFKFTLTILFISLIFSIVMYVITEYASSIDIDLMKNSKIFFLIFEFLFLYSLLSTALSVKDTMMFSHFRTKFIQKANEEKKKINK